MAKPESKTQEIIFKTYKDKNFTDAYVSDVVGIRTYEGLYKLTFLEEVNRFPDYQVAHTGDGDFKISRSIYEISNQIELSTVNSDALVIDRIQKASLIMTKDNLINLRDHIEELLESEEE